MKRLSVIAAFAGMAGVAGVACTAMFADRYASTRAAHEGLTATDAARGKAWIQSYGCGACHMIPGIAEAHGAVGPPLDHWSRRVYIAGEVPNTTDYLIRWIEMPQAIEPETAMPNLRVTEGQARDIAAYLFTLR